MLYLIGGIIILNIYLYILLINEQSYRRAIEVILSGLLNFSLNEKGSKEDRISRYSDLVYNIKHSIDGSYGGKGFYKLRRCKHLFRENACDEIYLNQIYNEAVEQGVAEMRQIEREQNEKTANK